MRAGAPPPIARDAGRVGAGIYRGPGRRAPDRHAEVRAGGRLRSCSLRQERPHAGAALTHRAPTPWAVDLWADTARSRVERSYVEGTLPRGTSRMEGPGRARRTTRHRLHDARLLLATHARPARCSSSLARRSSRSSRPRAGPTTRTGPLLRERLRGRRTAWCDGHVEHLRRGSRRAPATRARPGCRHRCAAGTDPARRPDPAPPRPSIVHAARACCPNQGRLEGCVALRGGREHGLENPRVEGVVALWSR